MVTRNFFVSEMEKLKQQFGDRFSQRKQDLIYLAVRYLSEQDFSRIVDDIIGNSRYTPTVADFRDRARPLMSHKPDKVECIFCEGNGVLTRYEKTTGFCFAFACECKVGVTYVALPKWKFQKQNLFTRFAPRKIYPEANGNPYEGMKDDYEKYLARLTKLPKTSYEAKKI